MPKVNPQSGLGHKEPKVRSKMQGRHSRFNTASGDTHKYDEFCDSDDFWESPAGE